MSLRKLEGQRLSALYSHLEKALTALVPLQSPEAGQARVELTKAIAVFECYIDVPEEAVEEVR